VYDHFGDKERIYSNVVDRISEKFLITVRAAIEEELADGCDLRTGLLAFARRVATGTFASSDYVLFRQLTSVGTARRRVPGSMRNAPKELFVQCMIKLAETGVVPTENPRRAADHFIALTFLLALDTLDPTVRSAWDEVDKILSDGVDTFLRAYT
jgi:TetR/AcrR family transcriptional repressor of mexJK operon